MKTILSYDGSFNGFLTCVFTTYEEKLEVVDIQTEQRASDLLFSDLENIITDKTKATRVALAIKNKCSAAGRRNLYRAFLSEEPGIELTMLKYLQYVFKINQQVDSDFSHPAVLKISKMAKKVGREKHRMEAFVRFKLTKDQIYFSVIEPDFNVLPLIQEHFKKRYADQAWIIYDLKRKYGLYFDLQEVNEITINFNHHFNASTNNNAVFDEEEINFQHLWKEYFNSTNIKSRKNMKLHLQHVPRRYWKYLSEKSLLHN
ncbi:TIGR03915 family putative DNA repair protein [Salegentibacter sp. F188]|uniref:TIGR03915 family putative DNA repair protein n=1 Tax=Autumnicola patrickiae TaxID=3075591 RepID=A0ABU3E097_9FLAO|nr:TIGR03915 family putative DNA repair protein [Salegentibacter sp. F188]MDT0689099.1 TIGR03915 family putative DNA repair protein [Salegentibacter sp. F188]